eukprot:TRINITY_DN8226_c0_g1_i1.p1 TRINITY_DN8226_c0_g1~~TRINITY_DN8226_c0_g1_i1.p1  ORF type:complete len:299 (+),score=23.80 TRINITY_DN8226_c0_g1_i1:51-947(+)
MNKTSEKSVLGLPQWFVHLCCGGIAGCVAKTCISPLDRVKILFQTKHPSYHYTGVLNTMKLIIENEGWKKLWRGNTATIVRVFPYAAIQFMSYEKYKKLLIPQNNEKKLNPITHLVCGSLAGATAVTFTYPLDLMRARLASQVNNMVYNNIFHGLALSFRQEGIKSWFKGMNATLQGILPYAGVNFCVFETLKYYAPKNEKGELPTMWKLICGGIAGPIGQTVSYPWDVVRRRQQTWGFAPGTKALETLGTYQTMKKIVQSEGFFALYRGISINYMKATPTVGITFAVYETLKYQLSL